MADEKEHKSGSIFEHIICWYVSPILVWSCVASVIPDSMSNSSIEKGYVMPRQVRIETELDINNNGKYETVLKYDGREYLFMLDKNGKPECKEFYIKPQQTLQERIIIKDSLCQKSIDDTLKGETK